MSFEGAPTEEQVPLTKEKIAEDEKSSLWEKVKGSKLATAALSGFMALSTIGCANMTDANAEEAMRKYENNRTARTLRVYTDTYTVGIDNSGAYKTEKHRVKTYRGPDESERRDRGDHDRNDRHEGHEHRENNKRSR